MSRSARLGGWIGASIAVAAFAQAPAEAPSHQDVAAVDLEDLLNIDVATGSKTTQRIEDAPGSVTVITRQQIADMNARSLRDVLNVYVPGMDVVPTYFRWGIPVSEGIYSRGLLSDFSQQVLVLFNGHAPFNDSTFSSPFAAIEFTLEAVERVEISRSPIPLLGGGAMTVINIITRDQYMDGAEAQLDLYASRAQDFEDNGGEGKRFTALMGKTLGGWHLGASVQYQDDLGEPPPSYAGTGGYTGSLEALRDGTRAAGNATFSVNSVDGKITAQMAFRYSDLDPSMSGLVASPIYGPYQFTAEQWTTNLQWRPLDWLELNGGSAFSRWSQEIQLTGTPTGGETGSYWQFLEATATKQFHWIGDHTLVAGLRWELQAQYNSFVYEWAGNTITSVDDPAKDFAPDDMRVITGLYAEDNMRLGPLAVLVGARIDDYLGWENQNTLSLSPRVAATWTATEAFTFKGLFSSSQRPPSLYERAGQGLYPLIGNPNVQAERVQEGELSAIFRRGALKVQVTPYVELFRDKIEFVPIVGGLFQAQNTGNAWIEGVDFDSFYYFTSRTYAFLNASYVHSYDLTAGHTTYFLPAGYVNGGFNFNRGNFDFNVTGYFRSTRPLPTDLVINQQYMAPSLIVNGSVTWSFHAGMKVFALIDNLTGDQVYIPLARDNELVPLRPRTFHIGLILAFD